MTRIKAIFRAKFEQPRGALNPSSLPFRGTQTIEVFALKSGVWHCRVMNASRPLNLAATLGAEHMRRQVEQHFETQIERWKVYGLRRQDVDFREYAADEIVEIDGKHFLKTAEDYTHIIHAPTLEPHERIPRAACGEAVKTECFINNQANSEPTCKSCAEIWRQHHHSQTKKGKPAVIKYR